MTRIYSVIFFSISRHFLLVSCPLWTVTLCYSSLYTIHQVWLLPPLFEQLIHWSVKSTEILEHFWRFNSYRTVNTVSPLQGPAACAVREIIPLYIEHMVTVKRCSTDLQMVKYCFLTAESLVQFPTEWTSYWICFSLFSPVIPCMAPAVGGSQTNDTLSLAQSIRFFVLLGVYRIGFFVPFNSQLTSCNYGTTVGHCRSTRIWQPAFRLRALALRTNHCCRGS